MKYIEDNKRYEGTPQEIDDFINLRREREISTIETPTDPYAPFNDVINESEKLRQELAINPDYNPFGGVIASKETEQDNPIKRTVTAEQDTGVELL